MKKLLFSIFAHPDDESFGPSATLRNAVLYQQQEVHLICITDGASGVNHENHDDLGAVRKQEWENAALLIGATSTHWLGYADGTLANNQYLHIAEQIMSIIHETAKNDDVHIDFITFDTNGISGHLDHIAVSMITTYVYLRLRENSPESMTIGDLRYYCIGSDLAPSASTDWLYMPAGRPDSEIDEVHDYSNLIDDKRAIMQAHATQAHDAAGIIDRAGGELAIERFRLYR